MNSPTTRKDINLIVKNVVAPLFILLWEHAARCFFKFKIRIKIRFHPWFKKVIKKKLARFLVVLKKAGGKLLS